MYAAEADGKYYRRSRNRHRKFAWNLSLVNWFLRLFQLLTYTRAKRRTSGGSLTIPAVVKYIQAQCRGH